MLKSNVSFCDTCAIILSAGNSKRMGFIKALLAFDDTQTFIQKIISSFIAAKIFNLYIVVNSQLYERLNNSNINLNAKLILNEKPELGRFFSLQLSLNNTQAYTHFFIHNIDNPFINSDIIEGIYKKRKEADCIIPFFNNKGGHPIIINKTLAEKIISAPYQSNLREFIVCSNYLNVEVSNSSIHININTPEDYQQYFNKKPAYAFSL